MTLIPNSAFDIVENRNHVNVKTVHNTIGGLKFKRLSKRAAVPLIVCWFSSSTQVFYSCPFLSCLTNYRRKCRMLVSSYNISCIVYPLEGVVLFAMT